jgi:signal transduction histidine kinase/putative methionine-R-sulfoxide reductase with GAF domain
MAADFARRDARTAQEGMAAASAVATAPPPLIDLAHRDAVERALRRVVRNVSALINATQATIFVADPDRQVLVPAQSAGGAPPARAIRLGQGIIGTAAQEQQSLSSDSVAHDARVAASDGLGAGSLLAVPLLDDAALLGVLVVGSERVHAFGARHMACAEMLADAAALTLARACALHVADAERRQAHTLVDTARAITSGMDQREIFEQIAGGISRMVAYDDAIIAAHDPVGQMLQVVASRGTRSAHLCNARVNLSDPRSISVRVAQTRQALVYTPDASQERPGHITEAFLGGEDLALLCVPLLAKDTLRGVITLARHAPFQPDDIRAMNDLAPLVATALENVALYASVRAEQAARLRVLQTISHEIKSPLHTLNGYLDLALSGMGGPVDERQGMLLQRARASGERLAAQVKDLLLVAYEEVGELPMQMTLVDLRRVLLSALEAVEIVAHEAGVTLHAALPPALPPLLADGERLGQVARNMLNNAIAHTPRGGHVTAQAGVCQGAVEFCVSDTGCGIAAEHLPRIFERFYRVPAAPGTVRNQGQGLGLAIVKTIVERHGGTVQVVSTPHVGSRFTIALPLQRAAPPEAPAAARGAASVG